MTSHALEGWKTPHDDVTDVAGPARRQAYSNGGQSRTIVDTWEGVYKTLCYVGFYHAISI
ncbi:hypothetical protein FKM82_002410 [Ascaphus truei]